MWDTVARCPFLWRHSTGRVRAARHPPPRPQDEPIALLDSDDDNGPARAPAPHADADGGGAGGSARPVQGRTAKYMLPSVQFQVGWVGWSGVGWSGAGWSEVGWGELGWRRCRRATGSQALLHPRPQGLKCQFPASGGRHAVEIVAEDLDRLEADEFLNDTVIDYYMK